MMYPMYYSLDPTYLLVIAGVLICLAASARMRSTFSRYSRVQSRSGLTGMQAAQEILRRAGIYDVRVERVAGNLTDHYDPRSKVLRLSDSTYHSTSLAAVGVAAHECGHAMQHAQGYAPLKIRGSLVPLANMGSTLAWPLIIIGLIFTGRSSEMFLNLGILAFSLAVLFQIVTLPVEFNASNRAIRILASSGIMYEDELKGAKKVLGAAALTYVAGAASSILQLLRIILIAGNRRR
ncbi:zinc metallopeptidase [Mordavella massiliensis]|uniref:Zinc metallopeptidase n=1 Tax=Mordavella massiliensis TaxID=1871024 RepID=A0A939BGV2_9CLOT|nr:zinc metallopeptidase [Mordavella massiliensis]MBM6948475.1 zinc metallopeptidase [Mordavella massiliensis]